MKNVIKILSVLLLIITLGCNNDDELLQIPASEGAIIDVNVGGPTQPNQVFVDLSVDKQTTISKSNWDIGFYSGDEFVAILNAPSEAMARSTGKNDISTIESGDYEGFVEQMSVDAIFSNLFAPPPYPEWLSETAVWIDNPNGDLNDTAIKKVSAQEEENEVYVISRGVTPSGESRGQYLIQITQNGSGYLLSYKELDGDEVKTQQITKETTFNFVYFDFDDGIVSVEPEKDSWDISFTTYMERLDVGGGTIIPYRFQDYVIQNRQNVEIAANMLEENEDLLEVFENFTLDETIALDYQKGVNSIGGSWRTVASPTPGTVTGVKTDRFYVIKDGNGNTYKLMFTGMLNSEGERGFPQILYEIMK